MIRALCSGVVFLLFALVVPILWFATILIARVDDATLYTTIFRSVFEQSDSLIESVVDLLPQDDVSGTETRSTAEMKEFVDSVKAQQLPLQWQEQVLLLVSWMNQDTSDPIQVRFTMPNWNTADQEKSNQLIISSDTQPSSSGENNDVVFSIPDLPAYRVLFQTVRTSVTLLASFLTLILLLSSVWLRILGVPTQKWISMRWIGWSVFILRIIAGHVLGAGVVLLTLVIGLSATPASMPWMVANLQPLEVALLPMISQAISYLTAPALVASIAAIILSIAILTVTWLHLHGDRAKVKKSL